MKRVRAVSKAVRNPFRLKFPGALYSIIDTSISTNMTVAEFITRKKKLCQF
jgi:hypothetical protein